MERVVSGRRRARYAGTWLGPATDEARAHAADLGAALTELESLGLAPVLEDGGVAGNGALRIPSGGWIVSASARRAGEAAVIEIVDFDASAWSVRFRGDEGREPTSDVALHLALMRAGARATLHGHALATEVDAARLKLPISTRETEFGTRADLEEMEKLLCAAPYPAHRAWIRRGHGFVVGAATLAEARALVRTLATSR